MAITDLPLEVLHQIMEDTMPDGFESLSMTCKSFYTSTPDLRKKHNHLKELYNHFSYDIYVDESDDSNDEYNEEEEAEEIANHLSNCYSSLQLLLEIANEPIIAKYIVTADFKNDAIPYDTRIMEAVAEKARTSVKLLSLLETSVYFKETAINAQTVVDHLAETYVPEHQQSGLAATFLLSLLPNVTTLTVPKDWETYGWDPSLTLWEMYSALNDIVARANDPNDPTASLSKLTTILPSAAWGYDCRWALSTFNPFLSITSVTKFIAGSCRAINDGYTGARFRKPENENYGKNVQEVVLAGSVIDAEEISTFLTCLPRLKDLKISYETKWHGCGHDIDSGAITSAIESATGDRLESLSFSIFACYGQNSSGVQGMKGFTKLKELEIDMDLLMTTGSGPRLPKLGDLLPISLERFVLIADEPDDEAASLNGMFDNAVVEVEKKLPNLKEIVIQYWAPGELVLTFLEEGLDGGSLADDTVKLQQDTLPSWKRQLQLLGKRVSVSVVRLDRRSHASFMVDFCETYGLEAE